MTFRFNKTYLLLFINIISLIGCEKKQEEAKLYTSFIEDKNTALLPDFSYAGYHYGEKEIPNKKSVINVSKYGITPNSKTDQTNTIQKLIDSIGQHNGGVLFFPSGEYLLNATEGEQNFLTIDYSNIVLRGEKNTVFVKSQTLIQTEKSPWLSPAIIRIGDKLQGSEKFWGISSVKESETVLKGASGIGVSGNLYPAPIITQITKTSPKGSTTFHVASTKNINKGDVILIALYNTSNDGDLIKQLMKPWNTFESYMKSALNAGVDKAPSYQWLVEVKEVNQNTITLMQPCRINIDSSFNPIIASAPMLKEIGIENITFKSKWDGEYCHHGCKDSHKLASKIMDYGWNAIQFNRTAHGWIKNVMIKDYTNPIYLIDSRNITVENISLIGANGHSGIKVYNHSNDNLIQHINFKSSYTHMLSLEGNAYGNVFRKIAYDIDTNAEPADFDFHGFGDTPFSPPASNLFEQTKGFRYITGGGATFNLPHSSIKNTFWNVSLDGLKAGDDVFNYWVYEFEKFGKHEETDAYKIFPGTILAGVSSNNGTILVHNKSEDQQTKWIHTENFNKKVFPKSLYKAQFNFRTTKLNK